VRHNFFADPTTPGGIGDHREFAASGTATGIGDVLLRAKGTVMRRGQNAIAVGAEVRVPSGDEDDRVLNSPQLAVTPFVARGDLGSGVFQDITFHFPVRILCDQQRKRRYEGRATRRVARQLQFEIQGRRSRARGSRYPSGWDRVDVLTCRPFGSQQPAEGQQSSKKALHSAARARIL
jgi:hypothetical protein